MKIQTRWMASALILALTVAAHFADAALAPPSMHFYLARVPATGNSCDAAAQELALRIRQSSSTIKRAEGRCITRASFIEGGTPYAIDSIEVAYEAPYQLELTEARLPSTEMGTQPPIYPSYSSCLSELPAQTALFEQATGLKSLTQSCLPGAVAYDGYTLRIDALGRAEKNLRVFRNASRNSIARDESWRQIVLNLLAATGGMPAKSQGETIAYYADSKSRASTSTWFFTRTREQCESQIAETQNMLNQLGAKHQVVACHEDSEYQLFLMDSAADLYGYTGYSESKYRSEAYFSLEECMAVRADALARDPQAKKWIGSFCVPRIVDPQYFELKVFTRL